MAYLRWSFGLSLEIIIPSRKEENKAYLELIKCKILDLDDEDEADPGDDADEGEDI